MGGRSGGAACADKGRGSLEPGNADRAAGGVTAIRLPPGTPLTGEVQ